MATKKEEHEAAAAKTCNARKSDPEGFARGDYDDLRAELWRAARALDEERASQW